MPKFSNDGEVVSHSEQFRVTGSNSALRGTVANVAEDAKTELLRLMEEKDEWKVPIRIELRGQSGDPVPLRSTAMRISFSETGYVITIYVNLSRGFQREDFRRTAYSALILAGGLEERPLEESDVGLDVPPWIVEGLREANAWRLKKTDRKLYDALFQHGGLFKLQDLFEETEASYEGIDAASRVAFRISAGALMMALLEQPEGKAGIQAFLKEVPEFNGEMPVLLRRHFPDLNLSENSLEKWWALQLANKGTAPLTEAFSVAKTEALLSQALFFKSKDLDGNLVETPITQWRNLAHLSPEERLEAAKQPEADLLRLSYRCFPSYRILLLEYQSLLNDFVQKNTDGLDQSLAVLAENRQTMIQKAETARDFLDYFEITRARETSGAFDDYLNLKARLKERPDRRKDPISLYLDRLDPFFALPEKKEDPYDGGFLSF